MNDISNKCKTILLDENIDSFTCIEYEVNATVHKMTFEYIIDTYMQASKESQLVFLAALQKSISAKDMGVERFFEGMGELLLRTHLSDKLEI